MRPSIEIGWSDEKNRKLKAERGLSFENVMEAIEHSRVLDIVAHPDPKRSHRRILVVEIGGYACGVPFVGNGDSNFLKTIYRSRDFQRMYLRLK
jgi:uncharacterized DUF497 family protein